MFEKNVIQNASLKFRFGLSEPDMLLAISTEQLARSMLFVRHLKLNNNSSKKYFRHFLKSNRKNVLQI